MRCIFCGHAETKVTNKRDFGSETKRRRECLKCKKRFTTYEKVEPLDLIVIKKDGRKEKFSIDKLKKGVEKALEKRPASKEEIEKMLNEIEETIRKKGEEIKTSFIGDLVLKKLKKVDDIAYIRFASVCRNFNNLKDFKKEIKELS